MRHSFSAAWIHYSCTNGGSNVMTRKSSLMRRVRDLLRKARRWARSFLGSDIWVHTDTCEGEFKYFGSDYGGWMIRKDCLGSTSVLYSVGIGQDISFDLALIRESSARVHAFDPTPASIAWLAKQSLPEEFTFHPTGLADYDGEAHFVPPTDASHISHSMIESSSDKQTIAVPVKRLSTLMNELGHSRIDLLKIDIEGAEYGVIADISGMRRASRPLQLLVEFHHGRFGIATCKTQAAITELRRIGYRLFWVSGSGCEYGFLLPVDDDLPHDKVQ